MYSRGIEDISERFAIRRQRNSGVVWHVRMKADETPFLLISLVEHTSDVDYNVVIRGFCICFLSGRAMKKKQIQNQKNG